MSFDNRTYLNEVSWTTYFANTVLNTESTTYLPNTWDTTIYPIDANEKGANPMVLTTECYAISHGGTIYEVSAINVDSNQYRITLKDIFFRGLAPEADLIGIIYKSAYKNYAFAIAPVWLNYLDKIAKDYVNSLEKAIFWRNDPNARRVAFTGVTQVLISDYTADVVDMDGNTFNPEEDYGQNPKFEIWKDMGNNKYSRLALNPNKTVDVDGNIVSVIFSGSGASISGYYVISR